MIQNDMSYLQLLLEGEVKEHEEQHKYCILQRGVGLWVDSFRYART